MNSTNEILNYNEFISGMSTFWSSAGNVETPEILNAWKTIHTCFENQLQGNPGLHVSDSLCGTGKTKGVGTACKVLAETQPQIGGLIVVRFISQAKEVVADINRRTNGETNVAFAFHSELPLSQRRGDLSYLKDYQFIVITHKSYLSCLDGSSTRKNSFRRWKHGERTFRVVDESLDLIERHSITKADIQRFGTDISYFKDEFLLRKFKYKDEFDLIDEVHGFLYKDKEGLDTELYDKVISRFGDNLYLTPMWEDCLEKSSDDDWSIKSKKKGFDVNSTKESIESFITLFDRIIRQELWLSQGKSKYGMKASIGQLILPEEFDSVCILDATSNVDRIYSLFEQLEETFTRYSVPRNVRNFTNARLHIMPTGSGIGKATVTDPTVSVVRNSRLIDWSKQKFTSSNKVLFVGHKEAIEKLRSDLVDVNVDFEYDFVWWGKIDGSNDWKDYDTIVTTSLMFLAPEHSPTAKLAFKTRMMDVLDIDGNDDIASSATLVAIIQMMCRIKLRNVREGGHCEPCDIYLPLESNSNACIDFRERLKKRGQYILKGIEESLNKIQVDEWDDFKLVNKHEASAFKPPSLSDMFINWISTIGPNDVYQKNSFVKLHNLDSDQKRALITALSCPRSLVYQYIQMKDIIKESRNGSGTIFYKVKEN